MHDVIWARPGGTPLGSEIDGRLFTAGWRADRAWCVKGDWQWAADRPVATGRQIEVLRGHYVVG
eukprot:4254864-Lingulodinium_polyedra.AAC.1